jgi:hypothetical protein
MGVPRPVTCVVLVSIVIILDDMAAMRLPGSQASVACNISNCITSMQETEQCLH